MINLFFDNLPRAVRTEQDLVEDLIIELIQISGIDVRYIPRNTNNLDNILNEAPNSTFEHFKVVEMYVNNYQDFGGNQVNLSQFGIQATNQLELVIAKKRFKDSVQDKPLAGDLIYDTLTKLLFQIDYVDEETSPAYQLQKIYVYTLKCSLYKHSYEDFNTGVPEIDTQLNPDTFVDKFNRAEDIRPEVEDFIDGDETNPFGKIYIDDEQT